MQSKIIEIASSIAIAAHDSIDQRRKYTDEPYWHHSKNVAYLVSLVTTDENMIAAAWLHDVLEDVAPNNPEYSADKLLVHVGKDVFNLVYALTEITTLDFGNRNKRKAYERERLRGSSNRVKTIKLADLIDNTSSIVKYGKGFAKVYLKELHLLLGALEGGDKSLYAFAVAQYKNSLAIINI